MNVEFDCPYQACIWPECQTTTQGWIAHPSCSSEVERVKREALRQIKPRPKPQESSREETTEEHFTRVDRKRRAAGPAGSTAASNEAIPTVDGPPWWCETCDSWRFTQPCGRNECPVPLDTII
jgi:hypothetical protein